MGFATIKLAMSKAYDRVEWDFLGKIMQWLSFHENWIQPIMKCVSSVSYKICVNGVLSDMFRLERGLRQGDPLSPYLFLLCAEGFSAMLAKAEQEGKLHGVTICRSASLVSHRLFVDDSLILCKANKEEAQVLKHILSVYEECSGHMINVEKSTIMFSPNISSDDRQDVMGVLNIRSETFNEKYLGLPVYVGRTRTNVFTYLKERIWQRVQGWKEKQAGKEVLIKVMAQAILVLVMGCFDIMKEICNQISAMIA